MTEQGVLVKRLPAHATRHFITAMSKNVTRYSTHERNKIHVSEGAKRHVMMYKIKSEKTWILRKMIDPKIKRISNFKSLYTITEDGLAA